MKRQGLMYLLCLHFIVFCNFQVYGENSSSNVYKPFHHNLVSHYDSLEYKSTVPQKDGVLKVFLMANVEIWDTSSTNFIPAKFGGNYLLYIEGKIVDGKKNGKFTTYVVDSIIRNKKYAIWEQDYLNGEINGHWIIYNLSGTKIEDLSFVNGKQKGLSFYYLADGKSLMEERNYSDPSRYTSTRYFKNQVIKAKLNIENGKRMGACEMYYENGSIQDSSYFNNNQLDGLHKYFHPNGNLWAEDIYKDGKRWAAVSNFDRNGDKRDAGTLKDGNGTVILYKESGKIDTVLQFVNGVERK